MNPIIRKKRRRKYGEDPESYEEVKSETFQIRYEKKLSPIAKLILNTFQRKRFYYAIDDILYSFKSNRSERENLLGILYSPALSLQNNFSVSFFDIWIAEIYINEMSKINRFLKSDSSNIEQFNYITIKLWYQTNIPIKKEDSLW